MTTRLHNKTVKRLVETRESTPLVVALAPEGIWLREPGRRVSYLMPYGVAWMSAVRMHLAHEKAEKKRAKLARQAAK